ncbi:Solute carrier family 22 member [Brachionus plicatilis]|uniref:Solute carrier family 22 member n=1 Tax=Brachionus plicatilis TaxID=10195 RepID=A0A3M7S2R4_BRAPC|nr:Solute carrier family 22 member [Brachionus plicatilis]
MENVLEKVGPFGKFQKCSLIVIGVVSMISAMTVFSTVFLLAEPNIVCVDLTNNQTISNMSNQCQLWATHNKTSFKCRMDESVFGSTIVSDWNLICNRSIFMSLIQTFYMIGTIFSFILGYLADRYGRKKTSILAAASIMVVYLVNNIINLEILNIDHKTRYLVFLISQIVSGMMNLGIFLIVFILLFEITSFKYHTLVTNVNLYLYVLAQLIICLVSYIFRDWLAINWFIGVFSLIVLILSVFFLPESPSFYIATRDYKSAHLLLEKMAKFNGKKSFMAYADFEAEMSTLAKNHHATTKVTAFSYIFHSKFRLYKTFALSVIYFGLTLTYYGVSLGITSVGGLNPYLVYILSAMAEAIGYMACHLNEIFRRKYVYIAFLFLASVMCLLVAMLPNDQNGSILVTVFALIGKTMISGAFNISYNYTSSMFPAIIRNTLSLSVSCVGRAGSIISPIINLLGNTVWKPLPYIIFSAFSLVGCFLIASLPEPKGFD